MSHIKRFNEEKNYSGYQPTASGYDFRQIL